MTAKGRKRVEAETAAATMKRARDGSAFTRCEACNKDVPVVLIDMHSCSLDSKIRMTLEAQVVEQPADAKKITRKRTVPSSEPTEKKPKKEKRAKDSSRPKRPPTAFFLFMDDFRKEYKEAHPEEKSVASVAKEGGEKWKSMSDEEKKPYVTRAAELKTEYQNSSGKETSANHNKDEQAASEGEDGSDAEVTEKPHIKEEEGDTIKDES